MTNHNNIQFTHPTSIDDIVLEQYIQPYIKGDTVWDIYLKHNPEGYLNGDNYLVLIYLHDSKPNQQSSLKSKGFTFIGLIKGGELDEVYTCMMEHLPCETGEQAP
jgi:hypothetical protein